MRCRQPVVRAAAVTGFLAWSLLVAPAAALAAAGDLATFAGSLGSATATSVAMYPRGVALDGNNLYVADTENNVVRKVDLPSGTASVVAGNGIPGFAGDGGPATSAQLDRPADVQVDSAGNLYVADQNNNRIRKITAAGVITTVAGDGTSSNTGTGGNGGPATAAQIGSPHGVGIDSAGNLFISEFAANAIRKVTPAGIISTFATGLSSPRNIAFDSSDNVYVTECNVGDVLKYPAAGGAAVRVAGTGVNWYGGDGGAATAAGLSCPIGLAITSSNKIYVADNKNHRIRRFTVGGTITTVAGTGTAGYSGDGGAATAADVDGPLGLAVANNGTFYVAQRHAVAYPGSPTDAVIRKITNGGTISTIAGNTWPGYAGDGGAATSAQLDRPYGVATDSAGNAYIADTSNHRVRKVTAGGTISTVAGDGYPCGDASSPCTAANFGDGGAATSGHLSTPKSVSVAANGDIYIADTGHDCIRKVSGGTISTVAGTGTAGFSGDGGAASAAAVSGPTGVTAAPDGSIYIADTGNNRVRRINGATITTVAGTGAAGATGDGGAATAATLNGPSAVAVSAGIVYIADTGNNRIRSLDTATGIITTVAGTGAAGESNDGGLATAADLNAPQGVTVDAVGNVYVADTGNHVVRRIDTKGIITTVAGDSTSVAPQVGGSSGDGGAGTSGELSGPVGLAVDSAGNLYLADPNEQRVRELLTEASAATWWVSDATVSHPGVTYAWDFTPLTTGAIGKVAITLTSTTTVSTAGLTVVDAFGIPAGGTLSLSGGVLTYSFAPAVTLRPGQHAFLSVTGFTNTSTAGFYAGTLTSKTSGGATVDSFQYGNVEFGNPADAVLPAIAPRITVSAPSSVMLFPDPYARNNVTSTATVSVATNAQDGYTLDVSGTALTGSNGTISAVSTGIATAVASGAFPVNRFGYTVSGVGGSAAGVAQGALATGAYAGFTVGGQTAVASSGQAAGDTISVVNRVKVDYLQPAGVYTCTLTYTVTPSY